MNKKIQVNDLFRNMIRVLSANFWVAVVGFASSIIFPRILTIDDYALYHTYTLYLTYITILHLGFPSGMVIKYAGQNYDLIDKKQYKTEILFVIFDLSFFAIVFFVLSIILDNRMLTYIALAIIPHDLIGSYKALLQAWSKFKKFSIISTVVATAVPVAALIYYVSVGKLPGDIYIIINLSIQWLVVIFVLSEITNKIKGVKQNPFFVKENWVTEKTGIALVLGNYINTLFTSADKQFVKLFFDSSKFAFYSFGMSMQALMTIFITSIAQPLFPAMAQGRFKDEEYNKIKELLIIFGSFSGCAYFVTSVIVKWFIPRYVNSLDVVGIYFVVFPAMSVVSCLYINLYKIKNLMRRYIQTLIGILVIAVVLNTAAVKFYPDYTGVSIATTITYYCWFFYGFKQFPFLKLNVKDILYLIFYTIGFFVITRNLSDFLGFGIYFGFIIILMVIIYRDNLEFIIKRIKGTWHETVK